MDVVSGTLGWRLGSCSTAGLRRPLAHGNLMKLNQQDNSLIDNLKLRGVPDTPA
jgi:hypothetical protein